MELRSLRYFVTVAEEGNITRAAEKLNMSQPPLTHQMQMLEEELGAQLLIRGKRRVTLTAEGTMLLRRARELLELERKTCSEIQEMRNGISGDLYVSMVEGRAPFLTARWIAGFTEEFPNVRYNLWNGSTDDVLERLGKGLADVGVVAAPYNDEILDSIPVGGEPWVAIIPQKHALAQLPGWEVELRCLVGEPLIVPVRKSRKEAIRRWFGEIEAEPRFLCETSNYLDAVALSEQGAGISIFPQTTYTPNDLVVSKEIVAPSRQAEYALVWRKDRYRSTLTEEFIHYVQDFYEEDRMHTDRFKVRDRE